MKIKLKKFKRVESEETARLRAVLKMYLALNGMTQKQYAKKIGVSETCFNSVINSKATSRPILEKIKKDVGPLLSVIGS